VSASARFEAAFRSFGIARKTTAVAAADPVALSSLTGSGAPAADRTSSAPSRVTGTTTHTTARPSRRRRATVPTSPRVLIASAAALLALALPAVASAATPDFTVGPVTEVEITKAKLSGTVDANAAQTEWSFEVSSDGGASWRPAFVSGFTEGSDPEPVEGTTTGLSANQPYKVRLSAFSYETYETYFSTDQGEEAEFTTDPAPVAPTATVDPATSVSYTSAQLQGAVDPEGGNEESGGAYVPIHWALQLSPSGDPGTFNDVASGDLTGADAESPTPIDVPASPAELSGLTPDHTYTYRLLVTYAGQTVESSTDTFKTEVVTPPVVTVPTSSEVAYTTAKAAGEVTAGNADPAFNAPCRFEYVTDAHFAAEGFENPSQASCDVEPTGTGATPVTANLSGLAPATEYHLRLVATNAGGTTSEPATDTFTTLPVAKPTITTPVISEITADSAHFSAEVDPGGTDPAFDTNWHFECTPACFGPFSAPSGTVSGTATAVAADAAGLDPNTTYAVRIVATNAGGTETRTETFQTAATGPLVILFGAGPVHSTTADLNGQVNPKGSSTVYWFEWGTADCEANPCTSIPAEQDASAGNGTSALFVTRHLTGLTPGTTYHFRLIAKNASATTEGPDTTFTTPTTESGCSNQGLPGADRLSACRAWEMASPPDKNGGDVIPNTQRTRAALDGSAVDFSSLIGFGDTQGGTIGTEYIAQRTATPGTSGWQTHGITPAQDPLTLVGGVTVPNVDPAYRLLSPDLSTGVFQAYRPITDAPDVAGILNLYTRYDLRTPGAGSYQLITDPGFAVPTPSFAGPAYPYVAGASSDFSHVIFESQLNFASDGSVGQVQLYESLDGALRLAGRVPPPGQPQCDDATDAPACEPPPSSQAGLGAADYNWTPHMISPDGSRVFFQAPAGNSGNVYMRLDGTTTVQLNASEKTTPEEAQGATLWTASADATRVFFSTGEGLIDEDEDGADDYYMYDTTAAPGHHLTLISGNGADSGLGIIGASDDGHYLYFMMSGQLVAGEEQNVSGIYVWHDGDLRFIGSFAQSYNTGFNRLDALWVLSEVTSSARVSADGSHLTFIASDDGGIRGRGGSSGFDATQAPGSKKCGPSADSRCPELYVYSADSGRLRCASCDPSGAPPTGPVRVNANAENYASATADTPYIHRALSDDGRWAFFSSPDALVPEDTNGKYDAYSYDTLTEEVHLLSSGTSDEDSFFMDASADGRDAFFTTRERLVGWDVDTNLDLYDARVGGGLPLPPPGPPPGQGCVL
jgi:hypothetical protein